jgi:hypothetical protein
VLVVLVVEEIVEESVRVIVKDDDVVPEDAAVVAEELSADEELSLDDEVELETVLALADDEAADGGTHGVVANACGDPVTLPW